LVREAKESQLAGSAFLARSWLTEAPVFGTEQPPAVGDQRARSDAVLCLTTKTTQNRKGERKC
jgi:hypothetical protein